MIPPNMLLKAIEHLSDRKIFVLIYLIVVILIIDTSITKVSAFVGGFNYFHNFYIAMFGAMVASSGFVQFMILEIIKRRYTTMMAQEKLKLHYVSKLICYANYGLAAVLLFILLQILFTSSYSIISLLTAVWISYGITSIMLGLLSILFFRWLKFSKSPVILAYTIAVVLVTMNSIMTINFLSNELGPVNDIVDPSSSPVGSLSMSSLSPNNILYNVTYVLSFVLAWVSTVLLMAHYTRAIGKAKYWLMVSIPLVYFLASFQPLILDMLLPARLADPILFGVVYTLFFSAAKPIGAVLFGIAFWALARNITNQTVRQYMLICSYGMIILFTANQPLGLILKPLPPFGLSTISFMPLASYLVLMGIYSAAISVSQDSSLRKSIRNDTLRQSDLINKIGFAESSRQIEHNVTQTVRNIKNRFEDETGVATSFDMEETKHYVDEVLKELQSKKEKRQ
jgi:hypothetical protein